MVPTAALLRPEVYQRSNRTRAVASGTHLAHCSFAPGTVSPIRIPGKVQFGEIRTLCGRVLLRVQPFHSRRLHWSLIMDLLSSLDSEDGNANIRISELSGLLFEAVL